MLIETVDKNTGESRHLLIETAASKAHGDEDYYAPSGSGKPRGLGSSNLDLIQAIKRTYIIMNKAKQYIYDYYPKTRQSNQCQSLTVQKQFRDSLEKVQ